MPQSFQDLLSEKAKLAANPINPEQQMLNKTEAPILNSQILSKVGDQYADFAKVATIQPDYPQNPGGAIVSEEQQIAAEGKFSLYNKGGCHYYCLDY